MLGYYTLRSAKTTKITRFRDSFGGKPARISPISPTFTKQPPVFQSRKFFAACTQLPVSNADFPKLYGN